MRPEESLFLAEILSKFDCSKINPILNLGSSTTEFRMLKKPHIQHNLFNPLEKKGFQFIHCDLKPGNGVDISGDIYSPEVQEKIQKANPKLILLSNVLEHVYDRQQFSNICLNFIPLGGYLLITVPFSYPYHPDPIDTLYRPTPEQICHLFPGTVVKHAQIITSGSAISDLRISGKLPSAILRWIARLAVPFYKPKVWLSYIHRLFWIYRSYQVSIVLLEKQL